MANLGSINDAAAAAYLARLAQRSLPAPRSMNRSIAARMARVPTPEPLADGLNRMERRRSLLDNRLDRLTPEQQERSLPGIQRAYEDYLRQQRRAAEQARLAAEDKRIVLGLAGATAGMLAGAGVSQMLPEQEAVIPEEPTTLEDIAWIAESPEDILPESIDLGEPLPIEPEVYIDTEDFDTEGLLEMIAAGQETPLLPGIADLMMADEEPMVFDMPEAVADDVLPEEELTLTRDAAPMQTPDRDPYMTNAQKRTVQVLMNAGIPSQRAGMIARGEASMSPDEYRMVTGGRR